MNTIIDIQTIPAVRDAAERKEVFWLNEQLRSEQDNDMPVTLEQIQDAEDRLQRFAPYLAKVFPETAQQGGIIESELRAIPEMKQFLNDTMNTQLTGQLYLKMDSHLPIAGSIKARGGIYEVLKHAEDLAIKAGMLTINTADPFDYSVLAEPRFQEFFHTYTVQVGSTGNLGMSIGIMSAKLGFQVIVHMSADAKQWKKDLLRSRGVCVMEYPDDYCAAVEEGRKRSNLDEKSYFVDDENSVDLFLGYSVAAKRLQKQFADQGIVVDQKHPLFVYLPCGIGGAPGGVAYGLKAAFGDQVHCFFTEPVESCCMLLGMATGLHDKICVQDIGISGKTDADGLAVGRPSAFVGRVMEHKVSGICTIQDQQLYPLMRGLLEQEDIFIEPSACASFAGLLHPEVLDDYAKRQGIAEFMSNATHIAWATGGSMVPEEMVQIYKNM